MKIILKNENDVRNFVTGCAFYSTGGGGDPCEGEKLLVEKLQNKKLFIIKNIKEIEDNEWIACAYFVGSIAPIDLQQQGKLERLGLRKIKFKAFNLAFYELEKLLDIKITALIATEIGGLNSSTSLGLAADIGIPFIDADLAGRAIPESTQSLVSIYSIPVRPHVLCDSGGNISIIKEAKNWAMVERIGKMISVAGGGLTATVGKLIQGEELKSIAIEGTMEHCYRVGEKIRESKGNLNPKDFAQSLGGWWLFEGEIYEKKWEDKDGYMYGDVTIAGMGKDSRHEMKIWFKNENHLSWRDGAVFVTSPDLIVLAREKTLEPLTNDQIEKGDRVWMFGFPCNKRYRIPKAIEVLGPSHFGFDYPYVPIEKITGGKNV